MDQSAALLELARRTGDDALTLRDRPPVHVAEIDAPGLDGFEIADGEDAVPSDKRTLQVYDAHAAFDLVDELEFLLPRAVEPNVFFAPRFLVPAMPRLDDRTIRLLVARDETRHRSRLRFFLPFTVEPVGWRRRASVRAWSHPFGPLGTPPLDGDDPAATVDGLFDALLDPALALPDILVLPDLHLEGPTACLVQEGARRRGLAVAVTNGYSRAALRREADGSMPPVLARHRREAVRQRRLLAREGTVEFAVAREPDEVRDALEAFLLLEAQGWKGRARSALLTDRYRSAFAREAVNGLAEQRRARVFTLTLNGEPVASLVVLLAEGEAALWKTAFSEVHRHAGPGSLVAFLASEALRADPAVRFVDSCAVPDHRIMNRFLTGRVAVGTLVVALRPGANEGARQVALDLRARRRRLHRRRLALDTLRGWFRL